MSGQEDSSGKSSRLDSQAMVQEEESLGGFDSSGVLGKGSGNIHNNPNWLFDMRASYQVLFFFCANIVDLISNLQDSVVAGCTRRVKDAIAANEDIIDVADRRSVQMEILNATVTYLEGVFGTSTPSMVIL